MQLTVFLFTYVPALCIEVEHWFERDYAFRIWASEFVKMWEYRFDLYNFLDIDAELYQPNANTNDREVIEKLIYMAFETWDLQ